MTKTILLRQLVLACSSALLFTACGDDGTTATGDDSSSTGGADDDDDDDDDDDSVSVTDPDDSSSVTTPESSSTDPTDAESSTTDPSGPESSSTDPTDAESSSSTDASGSSSTTDPSTSTSTTDPSGSSTDTGPAAMCVETTGNCNAPDDDCSCVGCVDNGACGGDDDCTCDDCDADGFCGNPTNCNNDGFCDPYIEGCICADCTPLDECDDFVPPACGDNFCDPLIGEDSCTCAFDCGNDPNACEACECGGGGGGNCFCDDICFVNGDCCANVCDDNACGDVLDACTCGDGVCDPLLGEDSCTCGADCPDDPDSCSSCECGGDGGNCFCDDACAGRGDCCGNVCDVGVCSALPSCAEDTEVLTQGPGLGVAISDNAYTGAIASMNCVTLNNAGDGTDTVASVAMEIGASHTWVGDLTMKVVSPAGTVVTVLSVPGGAELADDGTGGSGESSDLATGSPISFADLGGTDAETMGATIDANSAVCEDDLICDYAPNAGAATPGTLSAFAGESSVGNWQVCVGDSAAQDVGTIDAVTLTIGEI